MKSYQEYKERKEAKKFFRSNNDQFLSKKDWLKVFVSGCIWAIIFGVVNGLIKVFLSLDISLIYIAVGIAIANVVSEKANVSSKQVGMMSALLTVLSYYVTNLTLAFFITPFSFVLLFSLQLSLSNSLLDWIFIILGVVVAYYQGSENKFM